MISFFLVFFFYLPLFRFEDSYIRFSLLVYFLDELKTPQNPSEISLPLKLLGTLHSELSYTHGEKVIIFLCFSMIPISY